MNGLAFIFKQRMSEALRTDYPRVDEVVEAYLDMRDAAEEVIVAKLNDSTSEIPVVDQNVANARMLVVEFLTAQDYDAESYIAATDRARKLARKMQRGLAA